MPGVRYGDWRYGRRPPVLLSRQVLGIGLDEQFCEHRVHDVSPGVGGCLAVLARTGAPEVNAIHRGGMKTPSTTWPMAARMTMITSSRTGWNRRVRGAGMMSSLAITVSRTGG